MPLIRLCKSADSWPNGECPAVYTTDDPDWLIAQGKILCQEELASLLDQAADETAVRIPTETIARAVALLLAARGQVDLAAQVEEALRAQNAIAP